MDFDFKTGMLKREKPKDNSRIITGLYAQYQLSPEAEERFNQSFLQNAKGTVRPDIGSYGVPFLVFLMLGTLLLIVGYKLPEGVLTLLMVLYNAGVFLSFWNRFTWRLDFDGSTGFVKYHTLFGGTKTYHVTELMLFERHIRSMTNDIMVRLGDAGAFNFGRRSFRRGWRSYIMPRTFLTTDTLEITTTDGIISVPLATSWNSNHIAQGVGGYVNAEKFYNYLDMYRRHRLMREDIPQDAPAEDNAPDIPPAVREAIAAQKAQEPLPTGLPALSENDLNPTGVISTPHDDVPNGGVPDISVPVSGIPETHIGARRIDQIQPDTPAPKPEAPEKKPEIPAKKPEIKPEVAVPLPDPAAARAMMPQRGNDFPDPTKSAFPDPTVKPAAIPDPALPAGKPAPKPAVKPAPKPANQPKPAVKPAPKPVNQPKPAVKPVPAAEKPKKSPEEIDELFNSVLRQYGKK